MKMMGCSLLLASSVFGQQKTNPSFQKIKPVKQELQALPLHAVQPTDWLQRELRKNMDGFTGHLDSLVPDLILEDDIYGKNRLSKKVKSKNLGAVGEEGEWQVQYLWWNSETQSNWLDGFIRTAVLLNDSAQLQKAAKLVNRLLSTQDADGYIGIYDKELRYRFDNENGELWSKATLYRALLGWYEYKQDPRILAAIEKAVANVMQAYPINKSHPFHSVNPNAGGLTHGLVFTDVLEQLHQITRKQLYLDYCLFLYKDFSEQNLNEDAQFAKLDNQHLLLKGHGVHTYEHFRSVLAAYYASGNMSMKKAVDNFLHKFLWTISPSGGPIGDEFIMGKTANGSTGYEFCSLHELMAGWISMLAKSGDPQYSARAEHLFFNAAMGNFHPEESAICYLKQDNAYYLTGGNNGDNTNKHQTRYRYSPIHREAAVCCVPNAGRIIPYYVQHMWMKDKDGLVATLLGPSELQTRVGKASVKISEVTSYPFSNSIKLHISADQSARFSIKIRKPHWASAVNSSLPYEEVNGYLVFTQDWHQQKTINLQFTPALEKHETGNKEIYFTYGPLVLCKAIDSRGTVTKNLGIAGLKEFSYQPVQLAVYRYNGDSLRAVPHAANQFTTRMINSTTGQAEEINLVPMSGTILRQVSFQVNNQ